MKSFFDSSALAKRYVDERGSQKVEEILQDTTVLGVSVLCLPEIVSALCRRKREKQLRPRSYRIAREALLGDLSDSEIIQLTTGVLSRCLELLENNTLRAMDALHVACALQWRADLFISSDDKQLTAAGRSGLTTLKV